MIIFVLATFFLLIIGMITFFVLFKIAKKPMAVCLLVLFQYNENWASLKIILRYSIQKFKTPLYKSLFCIFNNYGVMEGTCSLSHPVCCKFKFVNTIFCYFHAFFSMGIHQYCQVLKIFCIYFWWIHIIDKPKVMVSYLTWLKASWQAQVVYT